MICFSIRLSFSLMSSCDYQGAENFGLEIHPSSISHPLCRARLLQTLMMSLHHAL